MKVIGRSLLKMNEGGSLEYGFLRCANVHLVSGVHFKCALGFLACKVKPVKSRHIPAGGTRGDIAPPEEKICMVLLSNVISNLEIYIGK